MIYFLFSSFIVNRVFKIYLYTIIADQLLFRRSTLSVAAVFEVCVPEDLQKLKIEDEQIEGLLAVLQRSEKTMFAVSSNPSESKL